MKLKQIGEIPVTVTAHRSLNQTKGLCGNLGEKEFQRDLEADILNNLREQKIPSKWREDTSIGNSAADDGLVTVCLFTCPPNIFALQQELDEFRSLP
ncbi:hypothetical protein HNY73_007073 [Argiope bruennichi]|uniref:Uncharacterized protein n=1 Tax=Argiope bruennichi TaxID=94029 RepID=A0A8T0FJV9_ARGBR|nr:hypothetical protein HNY73_007073 [Argiope bruennichi]